MGRRQTKELRHFGPLWPEIDDLIVETLLLVASGQSAGFRAPRANEQAASFRPEFEPLVGLAFTDPAALYEREYVRRFAEMRDGGHQIELVSAQDGERLRLAYDRTFRDVHAALSYGVLLVMDRRKRYAKALSQCTHCHRYYLAERNPKGGPANRVYCSPACRESEHNSKESRESRRRATARRKHK